MSDGSPSLDGRVRRAEVTRERVVEAYTQLLLEGNLRPTFAEIAERAEVSRRTVFNNFEDHAELVGAVGARTLAIATADFERISRSLPLDQRISRFARRRSRILERIAPIARSSQINAPFSEALQTGRTRHLVRVRQELAHLFSVELEERDNPETLLDSLLAATSSNHWLMLRDDLGLSVRRSTEVLRFTIESLLAHH